MGGSAHEHDRIETARVTLATGERVIVIDAFERIRKDAVADPRWGYGEIEASWEVRQELRGLEAGEYTLVFNSLSGRDAWETHVTVAGGQ
jgi:hypothetical protein